MASRYDDMTTTHRVVAVGSLAILLAGAYVVLETFLVPLLWAAILAYATWPLYRRLLASVGDHAVVASLVMTGGLIVLLFGPLVLISLTLASEMTAVTDSLRAISVQDHSSLLHFLVKIPLIGHATAERLQNLIHDPDALRQALLSLAQQSSGFLKDMAGNAARNLVKLGIALLTVFFLYLHGDTIVDQTRRATDYLGGTRLWGYMAPVTQAVNAVLYGLILTALAQGLLAGIAYAVAGIGMPALLGAATALLALVPFGAPAVWVPVGGFLILDGRWVAGVGVLLWGMLVVSWIDNLIRPIVISAGTRIPFLLVFFGVLGGAMAFGLIGLFLGPILLSVLLTVWREWTEAET
ncbi:MAG TPA: AI-2E family transporter [Gammaproteobacteria bacterium]|nr:AI-2E family transporter [Gammaproteobacteria bacterium]